MIRRIARRLLRGPAVSPPPLDFFYWRPLSGAMNFGDHLSSAVVAKVAADSGLMMDERIDPPARLLALGSIMHFARDGDIVWGSGVNGKVPVDLHRFRTLDVRAVRGPLTRDFLRERGIDVPEIYGDPGLLVPHLFAARFPVSSGGGTIFVPNLHDLAVSGEFPNIVSPLLPWAQVVRRIAAADFVMASSLHGVILAEAFGKPCRYVRLSAAENIFKYDDYMLGTGRGRMQPAGSRAEAETMGAMPPLAWDARALLAAFPRDLWGEPAMPVPR